MAKTFGDFTTRTQPSTADYIIGYDPLGGPIETKMTIQTLLDVVQEEIVVSGSDTAVRLLTGSWTEASTVVENTSADWNQASTVVSSTSATWNESSTVVESTSAVWNESSTVVESTSARWNETSTVVENTSADWNQASTVVSSTSARWNDTSTVVENTSAGLSVISTIVVSNSANWEETADIIPTVTDYLSTNNVLVSSLNVTGQVVADSSNIPVTIIETSTSKTFVSDDSNKIFHFDTTSDSLTANFPNELANGFNVALMNIGTNSLQIVADNLNSTGSTIIDQYGGAYVYKQNGNVYAVGRLF
jgi:hypothetical protein